VPQTVRVSVDALGRYWWNERLVEDRALPGLLAGEAARDPQPQLHIRGDRNVRYERVAQLMAAAQRSGLSRIGFVTEPQDR